MEERLIDRIISVAWKNHVPLWVAEVWVKNSAWYENWKLR